MLLKTKLAIPFTRPKLVSRPRLIERLNAGLQCKLTLISAQAGFGKTTLLGEWISQLSAGSFHLADGSPPAYSLLPTPKIAWISLDEGDNDPARFLAYLLGALQQVDETIGRSTQAGLPTPQLLSVTSAPQPSTEAIESLLVALINDIGEAAVPLVLVLDDYHLIQASPVHQVVDFLLEHQPPHVHLVISAREDPLLSLPRWRVRNQVVEIRDRDLRFTGEEATLLLNEMLGLGLSPGAVELLEARTEGWVAGLQLAALSLQECDPARAEVFIAAFAGDDRHVAEYLVDEVLRRQPEDLDDFLHYTSILHRLSAPLCDAVLAGLGLPASQPKLERLDAANLLIPLDDKRQSYRYHHLFADMLRQRLERKYPDRLADLHRRASRWYEQAGDVEEAIYHAFAVPDVLLAAQLAERYGSRMINDGRIATVMEWLERIPADIIDTHAYLCLGGAWAFALVGDEKTAERYVQAGEAALSIFETFYDAGEGRVISREEVRGTLTAVRAFCARMRGDVASVIEHSQQALEQLPADAYATRCVLTLNLGLLQLDNWELDAAGQAFGEAFETAVKSEENIYVAVGALNLLGNVLEIQGELSEAAERYRQAIELGSSTPIASLGYLGLAEIQYQRNELPAALQHLDKALELAPGASHVEVTISAHLLRARLALAAGDLRQAQASLDQVDSLLQAHASPHFDTDQAVIRGELYLAQGDIKTLAQHVTGRSLQPAELAAWAETSRMLWRRLGEYLLLVQLVLAQGQADEALALLESVVTAAEASRHALVLIKAKILQALACRLKRNATQAQRCLESALALAEPQGYVSPFLSASQPLDGLLRQLIAQDIRAAYAQKILQALRVPSPDAAFAPLREPLTERELQILRLLAAGLSSTEVAKELILAVSTVRSYIKTIHQKLDAHSRDEAIARGRQLDLL
jgi:LuxR family maltose regulon positive regulatory protein